jgi:hypothetical protein
MDNLENQLKKTLKSDSGFDPDKDQFKQKETVRMFYDNMRNVKIVFWIFMAISLAIIVIGAIGIFQNTGRYITWALFVALVGFNSTILMKLWYWIVSSKLSLLKEIKQLQLQIAELADKKSNDET